MKLNRVNGQLGAGLCQLTLVFVVTEDWYFASHRLPLARAAVASGYRVIVATRVREHGEVLRAAGCEVVALEWTRAAGNPFKDLMLLCRLVRLYRQSRPSAVHHVALKPVVLGSIAATVAAVPIVVNAVAGLGYLFTNRGGLARFLRPPVRTALRSLLNRHGTWVIVQNPDDLEDLRREAALEDERTVLIRGAGVDLAEFPSWPLPGGVPLVVLPARMLWDKGVREFVSAARALRVDGVLARFALVGGIDKQNPRGIERATIVQWVDEGVVEWWGHQPSMREVYQAASVVCLPSYREGLPKALLEAAASGRPIVTTDVPGCREVVTHECNGLLVPPRDGSALATALRLLLADAELRACMGARGRIRAETEFSIERVVADTLPLYSRPAP